MKAFALAGDEIYNRVRVEGDNIVSFAANCRHCAKPKCVEGCISGAMRGLPHLREHVPVRRHYGGSGSVGREAHCSEVRFVRRRRGNSGRAELRCSLPESRAHLRGKRGDVAWRTIRVIT